MVEEFIRDNIAIGAIPILLFMVLLWVEWQFPLRSRKSSKANRVLINLAVSGLAIATGASVVKPVALTIASWSAEGSYGLLRLIPLPLTVEFIVAFLLMDLSFYYWHRLNHTIPLLWRFHNVHHVDPDLDVSTSFRFHFVEILYSSAFRALQVSVIGVSLITYLVYEICFQCATLFHHSNVRLPIAVERVLNKMIVTPRMHGIHHSAVREETNSNYSVIFRWWDLLHGSLKLNVKQTDVVIGVPAYLEPQDNRFLNLLILPFRKQRDYWRLRSGMHGKRRVSRYGREILLP